jgi:two-component system response regulator
LSIRIASVGVNHPKSEKCILIAEDDENDLLLLRVAFQKAGLTHRLEHVPDGQVAFDYLTGNETFSDRAEYPFPDLLLLDLKMPRLNGFDVLRLLRSHPRLSLLPVVVLSSSILEKDIQMAKELGAREYLVKPTFLDDYRKLVLGLHDRWLNATAPLPTTDITSDPSPSPKLDKKTPRN